MAGSLFSKVDEDHPRGLSTPRGSGRKTRKTQIINSKNPYSSRGLDKFSKVLAELGARREKILARVGAEEISMVRFVLKDSKHWVPIIVKTRDLQQQEEKLNKAVVKSRPASKETRSPTIKSSATDTVRLKSATDMSLKVGVGGGVGSLLNWKLSYYGLLVLLLIILCLVLYGRAFAICCTSICWYLVPVINGECGNVKKSKGRRRLREMKQAGDASVSSAQRKVGAEEVLPSPKHLANVRRG